MDQVCLSDCSLGNHIYVVKMHGSMIALIMELKGRKRQEMVAGQTSREKEQIG